jgi:hypothetical protein
VPIHVFDPSKEEKAGWEPDVPASDSLLRAFLLNWSGGIAAQSADLGGHTLTRDDLSASDIGRPSFGANVVTLLAPLYQEDAPEVMAVLDDFYGFRNEQDTRTGSVFLFSPWPTPDLQPYGWSFLGYGAFMLRPRGGRAPIPPETLRIERVSDETGLRDFQTAIARGFGMDDLATRDGEAWTIFAPGVLHDPREHLWVGYEENRPVCAASAFVAEGIVDVTLVATVPEARRRGYGAAVTWKATLADPDLHALLIATTEGKPTYESIGYLSLFNFTIWSSDRPPKERP